MPPEAASEFDPMLFAKSARALLDEDWRRYRNFGVYWWLVKALLRRVYGPHQMPMLGAYVDAESAGRMPAGIDARTLLERAAEEYQLNASFNLGRGRVEDPDGEAVIVFDPDLEG